MGQGPSLHFTVLTKQQATIALTQAEHIDHYLEECTEDHYNAIARMDQLYYANANHRTEFYSMLFNSVIHRIPKQLHDIGEVKIALLMPSADGGMPHTRPPNLICYSHLPDTMTNQDISILRHEVCHVHQRKFPAVWKTIFRAMGWTVWNGLLPARYEAMRYNPDTFDAPLWIYGVWVPIPSFRILQHDIKLNQVEILFYNTKEDYHVTSPPTEIGIEGLPPSAYENPREISAYIIGNPEQYTKSPVYTILKQYIDL